MPSLFKYENYQVLINPELRLIYEFKALIARDKDREKRTAQQELAYIYFTQDYQSPYTIYAEAERAVRVSRDLKLSAGYKPDTVVLAAMEKYRELQTTVSTKTLTSIREGLLTSTGVIDLLRQRIDTAMKQLAEGSAAPDEDEGASDQLSITDMIDVVVKLMGLSEKMPKVIDTITSLEEKVKKEQSNESRIRGGGDKGMFED